MTVKKIMDELSGFPVAMKTEVISINKNAQSKLKYFGRSFKSFFNKLRPEVRYLVLAIPIIATFLAVVLFQRQQSLNSKASIHNASLSFQLQNWTLPPAHTFGVWINTDYGVSFADFTVSFDPTKVRMTTEASTTGSLARVVQVTSMSEANSTGRVRFVLALDPTQRATPPTSVFQLANLTFNANTTVQNAATSIDFVPSPMQIVASDQTVFSVTNNQNLSLVINPFVTPSPSSAPTPTPVPGVTSSPTPVATSKTSPTPSSTDVTPPTITITSPADGYIVPSKGNLQIRSSAQDQSGIYRMTIALDGNVIRTCNGTTSCSANINIAKSISGSHTITVTATDNSANRNTSSRSITVTKVTQ